MENFLKTLQSFFPLVAYYPKWAQVLFLTTFLFALVSIGVFVLQYQGASKAHDRAENDPATQLVDIGTPNASRAPSPGASDQAGGSPSIDQPRTLASNEFGNDFPVLDLKFHNPGKKAELITRIKLLTLEARVDKTPALEYSVEAMEENLVLVVRNFGWGPAKDFRGNVDLSQFGSALRAGHSAAIEAKEIAEATLTADGKFVATTFVLLKKTDLALEQLPSHLKVPGTLVPEPSTDEYWKYHALIKVNGVQPIRLTAAYAAEDGTVHTDSVDVFHIKRGVYDTRRIYFLDTGFDYVAYDLGMQFSLVSPSATYNFLVKVDSPTKVDEISVAHEVPSGGFDRLALTVGATKSSFLRTRLQFQTNTGRIIESPQFALQIWNPRNTFANLHGGKRTNSPPRLSDSEQGPYDVDKLRERRTRGWGY